MAAATVGGSFYMIDFALSPDPNRADTDSAYRMLYSRVPDMRPWTDSLLRHRLLRDTFITVGGQRRHALFAASPTARGRTAIVVHGYRDNAVKFLFLARIYHRDMGFNVILPDLYAHGLSDGGAIRMGWLDRFDIVAWADFARRHFAPASGRPRIVVHGVSMGAATTLNLCAVGGIEKKVDCLVADCGFTSARDEFAYQLGREFGLPAFPLIPATSLLCRLRYGWSFGQASPLRSVGGATLPIFIIHGSADSYVPTPMAYRIHKACPGRAELWIAPGSEHAMSYIDHPAEYTRRVVRFVGSCMGGAAGGTAVGGR